LGESADISFLENRIAAIKLNESRRSDLSDCHRATGPLQMSALTFCDVLLRLGVKNFHIYPVCGFVVAHLTAQKISTGFRMLTLELPSLGY